MKYKLILIVIVAAAIIGLVWISQKYGNPANISYPKDVTINNTASEPLINSRAPEKPYDLPYARMKSVSFGSDRENLYITVNLEGKIPISDMSIPETSDKVTGLIYYIDLDENYFDSSGNVNPSRFESNLNITFIGTDPKGLSERGRNTYKGTLVAGGPGFDNFTVSYPYFDVIFNQTSPKIVTYTTSLVTTEAYPAGALTYELRNKDFAVEPIFDNLLAFDIMRKE